MGKTTGPFRYDLNQIPYYTVEVRNRFKGLDLIDRVPDELWTEVHDIVPTRRVPSRGSLRVPAPLPLSPFSPPDRDRTTHSSILAWKEWTEESGRLQSARSQRVRHN